MYTPRRRRDKSSPNRSAAAWGGPEGPFVYFQAIRAAPHENACNGSKICLVIGVIFLPSYQMLFKLSFTMIR